MSKYREESRQRRQATREERKAKAMSGRRVEFLTCPLCGFNRPLETYKGGAKFQVRPDYAIIQVRYGGGRGSGFFLSLEESTKLDKLKESYPDIYLNLKEQVDKLHEAFSEIPKG